MAAPHNKERYGELWAWEEIAAVRAEIEQVKDFVVVSGGWAWHYMTPSHEEMKHAHDHKDADLFVFPDRLWELMPLLHELGFEKAWTRFDGVTENFTRYVKHTLAFHRPVKVIFDLFVESAPWVSCGEVKVVEPRHLLSLYGVKHSSDQCFSVQIARQLLEKGEDPVGHPAMADYQALIARQK